MSQSDELQARLTAVEALLVGIVKMLRASNRFDSRDWNIMITDARLAMSRSDNPNIQKAAGSHLDALALDMHP